MRVAPKIELDAAAERELKALSRRGRVEARVQQRAKAVLLAAQRVAEQGHRGRGQTGSAPDCAVAPAVPGRRSCRAVTRCAAAGAHSKRDRRGRIEHRVQDASRQADCRHALEHAYAGRAARPGAHNIPTTEFAAFRGAVPNSSGHFNFNLRFLTATTGH